MPRPIVIASSKLRVLLDRRGRIRDFIGKHNILQGHFIRLGIWVEGEFSWLYSDDWSIQQSYIQGTDAGLTEYESAHLGLRIEVTDVVDPRDHVLNRHIRVQNLRDRDREVRVFQSQDFRLKDTDIADTALYDPRENCLMHYKGGDFVIIECTRFDQYACGIKAFKGAQGTWVDAEDGHLSGDGIAQGSVDSTFAHHLVSPANGSAEFQVQIFESDVYPPEARRRPDLAWMHEMGHESYALRKAALSKHPLWDSLPIEHRGFLNRCAHMLEAASGGGFVSASDDTDIMETNRSHYRFLWPRDAAHVASVSSRLQLPNESPFFLHFVLKSDAHFDNVLYQKYDSEGHWGASWHPWTSCLHADHPYQGDQNAMTVSAFFELIHEGTKSKRKSTEFDFLISGLSDHIDPLTGLPLPSWDLWEERYGVHIQTVAETIKALTLVSKYHPEEWRRLACARESERMTEALFNQMVNSEGRFVRMIREDGTHDDTVDAAILQPFLVLPELFTDQTIAKKSLQAIEEHLAIHTPIGGFARYQGDYYFRKTDAYPGNPWVICTMWVYQTRMRFGADPLETLKEALDWALARAETTGILAEQFHPETGEPLSVSPLTWSHAEVLQTFALAGTLSA